MDNYLILTVNPGSTSTKIALFRNEKEILKRTIIHSMEEVAQYKRITDQYDFRKKIILDCLKENSIDLKSISCIVGRGGLVKPIPSGVYTINKQMREDLKTNLLGEHASNLGGLLAYDIAKDIPGVKAFIADPVVVDEMEPIAKYSGHPQFRRNSIFHALNQKAIARRYASDINREYEDLNLIIVHMGGGISVGAHKKGKVVDVNDGLNGEGPFTPERSGSLTALSIAKLCFSGKCNYEEIKKMIIGSGGLVSYLGTNNIKTITDRIDSGDNEAKEVLEAMCYQTSKFIASMAIPLKGDVDAILLTGGAANSTYIVNSIKNYVKFIADVKVYPGEDEMLALAQNGYRALSGQVEVKEYKPL